MASSSIRSSVVLLAAFLVVTTVGKASTSLVDGYSVRVWQTDDGLPENLVTSAVQTRDGYLWFGTNGGLARFDGERFEVFDSINSPGLRDRRITRLFADANDALWIGHDSGIVTRFQNGRFDLILPPPSGLTAKIIGLGRDEQGGLWAMHESGRIDSLNSKRHIPSLMREELPAVMAWSHTPTGNIWVAENGQAAVLRSGKIAPIAMPPAGGASNYVQCVAAAPDGGAWIFCDGKIRKWKDGHWAEDRGEFAWSTGVACSLELRDGTLAIGTIQSGLHLVYRDGRPPVHFDLSNGLPQNWVRFLYEDGEGNLWAGAGSAGLVSIHKTAFSVLKLPLETRGCSALSVAAAPDGALWIGTDGSGLYRHVGGLWDHYGPQEGLANWYVPAVAVAPDGDVWASDFWWGGPYRLEQGHFNRAAGTEETSNPVYALLPLGDGGLLVGNRDGLRLLKDGRATWLAKAHDAYAPEVCAIARDPQGVIWCGFKQGGVARIADGKLSIFRQTDGLTSDAVQSLLVEDDGTLWIGTADHGLSRFKHGRFANLSREEGLLDLAICAIVDDGLGYFWLSTRHGIQRIAKDELNLCADGRSPTFSSHIYDRSDGLPVVEFGGGFQSVACKTPDGHLWFTSSKGLVGVDPAKIETNPILPPVVLESLLVDGTGLPIVHGAVTKLLKPDHQRLEFRFSGLSFVAPDKVLFKYRLDGIDQTWIEAGAKRSAYYSRLPAGAYRFRVTACNNDGVWNTEGASLTFVVAPFFWETWWFISACLIAAAVIVAWFARYFTRRRLQRKIELMERQHGIERERSRIAQDIHDDVGASLSRIAMLSQPARADLAEPKRTADMLSHIYTTAREVTRSLDEIVWAVDPQHDTLDSLVDYMAKFAQNFLAAGHLRCRLDLPVDVPAWPLTAETRHNLFLAFKEALNNAMKHAAASEVRISFRLHPDSFAITVQDNGRGFDPAGVRSSKDDRIVSGHGFPNMQARLVRIGGRSEVTSKAGSGTTVTFTVAVAKQIAYPLTPQPDNPGHPSLPPNSPSKI